MIHGIGTDLVDIERCKTLLQRRPQIVETLLTPAEQTACAASDHPGRFLARHIAAKEALGKALGRGLRAPVELQSIEIAETADTPPQFVFHGVLAGYVSTQGLRFHLSLSDATGYASASVVAETGVPVSTD